MISPTPPHDPLTVTPDYDPPREWAAYDEMAEPDRSPLYGRHSRIVASVVYLGVLYFAWRSGWFVPFVAGSLATFGALLVWAESK